jgi:hypothetical protein
MQWLLLCFIRLRMLNEDAAARAAPKLSQEWGKSCY